MSFCFELKKNHYNNQTKKKNRNSFLLPIKRFDNCVYVTVKDVTFIFFLKLIL